MGRRSNYDNRGFQQQQGGGDQQGGGVFGRLSQQPQQQQQQQRQPDTRQGGWGSGYRGNQGQQERSQNRFGAFNQEQDDRWNPNQQPQGRGGQRRDKPQQAADWRAVVRDDVKTEQQQPPWPFTCYAHQRGGPNDMVGDFSYDEVRWYQMEAAKSGKPLASLMADFNASRKAQEQQFQALLRMNHPPSLSNVPPTEPPNPFTAQQNPFQPATPFNQIVGAFGANPAAMPPSPAFGSGFAPSPAQSMPTAGPFTSSTGTGFGMQQQASPTTFGSQRQTIFGQPAEPQQSSFPFGQGTSSTPGGASSAFGFGGSSPAGTSSGAQQQQQHQIGAFGSGFQKGGAAGDSSTPQEQGEAVRVLPGDSDNPWLAHSFQQGKIPETPPPPEVC